MEAGRRTKVYQIDNFVMNQSSQCFSEQLKLLKNGLYFAAPNDEDLYKGRKKNT